MSTDISAGLLMFHHDRDDDGQQGRRNDARGLSVLLAHPGGPFFRNKDEGAWTIPKGLVDPGEDLLRAACREFTEETGLVAPSSGLIPLGEVRQKSGKVVHAWAFPGELPEGFVLTSSQFTMMWPPRSGKEQSFPEIDRVEMFPVEAAAQKILAAQRPFLDRLAAALGTL
ncbi:MAG TPA: NUDIX domain-containing protein [Polyangia bacterium]